MQIHIRLILSDIIAHYKLYHLVKKDGWIYMETIRVMYGIPQAGIIANNLLAQYLDNHEYYQVKYMPGLWQHVW